MKLRKKHKIILTGGIICGLLMPLAILHGDWLYIAMCISLCLGSIFYVKGDRIDDARIAKYERELAEQKAAEAKHIDTEETKED